MGRIALYVGDRCEQADRTDLRPYSLGARAMGLRIVTFKLELPKTKHGRRPILEGLLQRMAKGEFEAIIAVTDIEARPTILQSSWPRLPGTGL